MTLAPLEFVLLTLVPAAGGLPPLRSRAGGEGLHLFLSASTGFLLGNVFFEILPAALPPGARAGGFWGAALAGILVLLCLDLLWFGPGHATVGWGTLCGLVLHAAGAGAALGLLSVEHPSRSLLVGFGLHRLVEGFTLAAALRLAGRPRWIDLTLLVGFGLVFPAAVLAGASLQAAAGPGAGFLPALSAGCFLYVALGHLLPEVLHGRRLRPAKALLLLAGVSGAWLL